MRVVREHFRNIKDLPDEDFLTPGSSLCAGCGGLTTLRLMHKILGGNVVIVNAAGCMTLLATFPFTSLKSSWLFTSMGSASAGAQGIRDALDVLLAKKRIAADENLQVLVLAGDGATSDLGLASMSGAIHRGLDFWYLCYDNEAYGNTGFQMSAASPAGSHTATSSGLETMKKKDMFAIWCAHRPPYAATVSTHDPVDLAEKIVRAKQYPGPKLFLSLAVCPTGWGFDPEQSDRIAALAIETGSWPLKEAVAGKIRHTWIPEHFKSVEEYLQPQGRFRHLFVPERNVAMLEQIQQNVDGYWQQVGAHDSARV